jgi:hypothetical protein
MSDVVPGAPDSYKHRAAGRNQRRAVSELHDALLMANQLRPENLLAIGLVPLHVEPVVRPRSNQARDSLPAPRWLQRSHRGRSR